MNADIKNSISLLSSDELLKRLASDYYEAEIQSMAIEVLMGRGVSGYEEKIKAIQLDLEKEKAEIEKINKKRNGYVKIFTIALVPAIYTQSMGPGLKFGFITSIILLTIFNSFVLLFLLKIFHLVKRLLSSS
jgi:hypothetical protein